MYPIILINTRQGSRNGNVSGSFIAAIEHPSSGCFIMRKKHGLSKHPIYKLWIRIKERCYNEYNISYKNYGGRGIEICDEWRNEFKSFYNYVTQLPDCCKRGYTLDRENNEGNYGPGNLRWVNKHVQQSNQRKRKNKTGFTGVQFNTGGFASGIRINGEWVYLGNYKTAELAAIARDNYIITNNLSEYFNSLNILSPQK